jgi:DNA-binding MarR family transcriptional regulator
MTEPIARQIRQNRAFRSPRQAAVVGVLRVADVLNHRLGEVTAVAGLTAVQYNILRILRGAGFDGLPTMEIGERLVNRAPGLTRLVDKLEADGLVQRVRCTTDRRQVFCRLTAAGLERVNSLDPALNDFDESSLAALNDAEISALNDCLGRVLDALSPPC